MGYWPENPIPCPKCDGDGCARYPLSYRPMTRHTCGDLKGQLLGRCDECDGLGLIEAPRMPAANLVELLS